MYLTSFSIQAISRFVKAKPPASRKAEQSDEPINMPRSAGASDEL